MSSTTPSCYTYPGMQFSKANQLSESKSVAFYISLSRRLTHPFEDPAVQHANCPKPQETHMFAPIGQQALFDRRYHCLRKWIHRLTTVGTLSSETSTSSPGLHGWIWNCMYDCNKRTTDGKREFHIFEFGLFKFKLRHHIHQASFYTLLDPPGAELGI